MNAQVAALANLPGPEFSAPTAMPSCGIAIHAAKGHRLMYASGNWVSADVYDRQELLPGSVLHGPAIVEQADTSTVVLPGDVVEIDGFGNLLITVGSAVA